MTERARIFLVTAAVLATAGAPRAAEAGPSYSLGRKAVCAEAAIEVELVFDRSAAAKRLVARAAAARQKFPERILAHARAGARVTATFYGTPSTLPKSLDVYLPDRRWPAAYQRGRLRALLFVRRLADTPRVLYGVEGAPNDGDADYPRVRAALFRYARWRDQPGDASVIAQAEKTLATTSSEGEATLAASFLCTAGHADAEARATRAALPSSAAARIAPYLSCPSPPTNCSEW